MKFECEISLGNAAMANPTNVAEALADLANRIKASPADVNMGGPIKDTNGNECGKWRLASPRKYEKRAKAAQ